MEAGLRISVHNEKRLTVMERNSFLRVFKEASRQCIYIYVKNKDKKASALIVRLVVFTRVKMLRGI
jgi:hypothetical protein